MLKINDDGMKVFEQIKRCPWCERWLRLVYIETKDRYLEETRYIAIHKRYGNVKN